MKCGDCGCEMIAAFGYSSSNYCSSCSRLNVTLCDKCLMVRRSFYEKWDGKYHPGVTFPEYYKTIKPHIMCTSCTRDKKIDNILKKV
jgi:hypothetical protein